MNKHLSRDEYLPFFVLLFALAIHLSMLPHDLGSTTVFFNADRALTRWETLRGFMDALEAEQTAGFLASHGVVGDYALHAILYEMSGKLGVILAQIGLALLSGWGVYRIGRLIKLSVRQSSLAAGIYLLLPHTLVFPHQLISEALYIPLLVVSVWATAEYLNDESRRGSWGWLASGALLVGIATLIRPITLLWPLIVGFAVMRRGKARAGAAYVVLAYLPVLLWIGFVGMQTGKFSMGESSHDMGHNLYQRVARISETMPTARANKVHETFLDQGAEGSLGPVTYIRFALEYPLPFARHTARDLLMFVGKSGVERISIDYLELNKAERNQLQDDRTGWRQRLERDGPVAAIRYLWQTQGEVLVISLVGAVLMVLMIAFSVIGGWVLMSSKEGAGGDRYISWLLICLPLYILVFSQLVNAMQSRHRAPAEAAIVLLAVAGGSRVSSWISVRLHKDRVTL